jgi:hypothetical protein
MATLVQRLIVPTAKVARNERAYALQMLGPDRNSRRHTRLWVRVLRYQRAGLLPEVPARLRQSHATKSSRERRQEMNRLIHWALGSVLVGLFIGFALTMGWIVAELVKEMSL